jgi:RDD family
MNYPYTSKRVGATLIDYTLTFALTILYIVNFGEEDGPHHYTVSGLPALVPVAFWFVYFVITTQSAVKFDFEKR